jgi:hypothetical protein
MSDEHCQLLYICITALGGELMTMYTSWTVFFKQCSQSMPFVLDATTDIATVA